MESDAVVERVRNIIARTELTNEAFAEQISMDPTKLSKSLNSRRRFTSLELAQVAQAGEVTVDWLLNGEVEGLAARLSPQSTGSLSRVIDEARRIAEARENLIFLGIDPSRPEPPPVTSKLWMDQGNELADFALDCLGMPDVGADTESFATAIERNFHIDVSVIDTDGACDGLAFHSANAKTMVIGRSQNPTRQRFTMAHELCHLICRDDQEDLHVDQDITATGSKRGSSEVRANAFGAALLMPGEVLRDRTPKSRDGEGWFDALVMELMVSPSALSWRLFHLDLIDSDERRLLGRRRTLQSASAVGQVEKYSIWLEDSESSRVPTALIADVLRAYMDGKTTLQPLATLLQVDVGKIRAAIEAASVEEEDSDEFVP